MTHVGPMAEHEGEFDKPVAVDRACRKCGKREVTMETWDSSDGAYTDEKYTCGACGHSWWVDGPDA
jgi:DNA-directed RNA polymerase subunit M/transcription elongation factor TFIIS